MILLLLSVALAYEPAYTYIPAPDLTRFELDRPEVGEWATGAVPAWRFPAGRTVTDVIRVAPGVMAVPGQPGIVSIDGVPAAHVPVYVDGVYFMGGWR